MPDVLIAGGGPAGLAAAIALAERGLEAVVVDPGGGKADSRAELLPQAAAALLDRLGLGVVPQEALTIRSVVSRWGAAHAHAHGGHPGLGLHGWGVDRQALSEAMLARLPDAEILRGRVTHVSKTAQGWRVTVDRGAAPQAVFARYVIDATGRVARVARRAGATALHGPELVAVTWSLRDAPAPEMWAEATPDGWWYCVPRRRGGTLGFMTTARRAKAVRRAPGAFLTAARDRVPRLPDLSDAHAPRVMDARSSTLDRLTGRGWLATGDAACAFDPIASQGLFNALSGGFFAGQAAADVVTGDPEAALVYEALAQRTAERSFAAIPLQYAARPFDTAFWRDRHGAGLVAGAAPAKGERATVVRA